MRVAIVGGGIGGQALALSLVDAGLTDIDVYESASAIRELGVGINLLPHAVRELTELGLLDELRAVAVETAEWCLYSRHGQRIWCEPRGVGAGYRWPQLSIDRGKLLGVLYRAVVDRLGPDRVHPGHHLDGWGHVADSAIHAEFIDRTTGAAVRHAEADVLVGCDGIHSAVRRSLYSNEGPPRWTGVTLWRGVTEAAPFLSGRTMIAAGYTGRTIVVYPISEHRDGQDTVRINWVGNAASSDSGPMPPQDWDHTGDADEALDLFGQLDLGFLDVSALIRGARAIFKYPMVDRDPLPSWAFGRVTLLGDAAHPMYPIGANGASQAILDARVLARELARQPSIEAALAAYDDERRPATAAVVEANRREGPMRPLRLVHERAPDGFSQIEDVLSAGELADIAATYKRTAGFDVDALNARPSLSVQR